MNRRVLSCLFVTLFVAALAKAETRMEKTLKIDAGGRLEVDTELGAITVTGTSRSDIHVVVTSKNRDLEDLLSLRFEDGGKTARVTGRRKGGHLFSWSDGGSRVQFEIEVPTSTAVDLDTSGGGIIVASLHAPVRIHSSGGSLDVREVVGDVDGHTSGGGVRLASIKGTTKVQTSGGSIDGADLDGPVTGDTSGGGITMKRVTGDLRVHSSGGSIHIAEAGGLVDADTSGGGIHASFARGNSRGGRLESSGGSIELSLDPKADLEIDASAERVTTDLPLQVRGEIGRRHVQGTLGKGGAKLRIHTSGGGIRIDGI
jgi:putative adhesin